MEEGGRQTLKALVALGALVLAMAAALAQDTLAGLAGRWEVVGVALRPATVQSLTVDDPGYMGAVLEVSGQRLAFVVRPGGTLDDGCVVPRWNGALVTCATGEFGPAGSMLTSLGEELRLE